jgi:hypothetical protein
MPPRKPQSRANQGAKADPKHALNVEKAKRLIEGRALPPVPPLDLPPEPGGRPRVPRNVDGTFRRGVSGNPGGRPAAYKEFVELAREVGAPTAFDALVWEIEQGDFAPARVKAAETLLAYAWGKPTQAVELTGKDGSPLGISDEERAARIAAIIQSALERGKPQA